MTFSSNITTVLVLRFLAGALVPGGFVQGIVLISELLDGKHRPIVCLMVFLGQLIRYSNCNSSLLYT